MYVLLFHILFFFLVGIPAVLASIQDLVQMSQLVPVCPPFRRPTVPAVNGLEEITVKSERCGGSPVASPPRDEMPSPPQDRSCDNHVREEDVGEKEKEKEKEMWNHEIAASPEGHSDAELQLPCSGKRLFGDQSPGEQGTPSSGADSSDVAEPPLSRQRIVCI